MLQKHQQSRMTIFDRSFSLYLQKSVKLINKLYTNSLLLSIEYEKKKPELSLHTEIS